MRMQTTGQGKRVNVPVSPEFRTIARLERRSIAQQAALIMDQYVQRWQSALPTPHQARGKMSAKRSSG
jgi:hypothetical protein